MKDDEIEFNFAESRFQSFLYGRFTSPDGFENDTYVSDPSSWNLYAYGRNSPLVLTDPSGMFVTKSHLINDKEKGCGAGLVIGGGCGLAGIRDIPEKLKDMVNKKTWEIDGDNVNTPFSIRGELFREANFFYERGQVEKRLERSALSEIRQNQRTVDRWNADSYGSTLQSGQTTIPDVNYANGHNGICVQIESERCSQSDRSYSRRFRRWDPLDIWPANPEFTTLAFSAVRSYNSYRKATNRLLETRGEAFADRFENHWVVINGRRRKLGRTRAFYMYYTVALYARRLGRD